jgi:hypothetical protein
VGLRFWHKGNSVLVTAHRLASPEGAGQLFYNLAGVLHKYWGWP